MRITTVFFCLFSMLVTSQEVQYQPADSLYREDQFYIGIQNCLLNNKPTGVSNGGLSLGFNVGFFRDFPINKTRRVSIAPGFGYSFRNYNTSIVATHQGINDVDYKISSTATKNYMRFQYIDFPVELRWRNSTPDSHKFLRIYTGFKLSYLFYDKSYYLESNVLSIVKGNPDLRSWTTSVFTSIGWNTWNIYVSYGLNPLYKLPNHSLSKLNSLDLGLVFYIL